MKGIVPLFLGIFGTFAFSWAGLVLIPNYQIGHLDPQMDEDGNDPYPAPKSGMADRGGRIYAANGCVYCHSQQVRAEYAASDIERKWGVRRSAPRDYLFERPIVLGKMRLGPDLANVGKRAPAEEENAPAPASSTPTGPTSPLASPATNPKPGASPSTTASAPPAASPAATATPSLATTVAAPVISPAKVAAVTSPAPASASPAATVTSPGPAASAATTASTTATTDGTPLPYTAPWHHRHLYSPRSLVLDSNMPAYHFLYEKRRISGERAADALQLGERDAVPEGWEVVPTYDAKCLVAYLMSLDQSHALNELKATAAAVPPSASAPSPATSSASPTPAPSKEVK